MIWDDDEDLDRERSRRRWNAYLDEIDAEIREERAAKAMLTADIGKAIEPDIVIKPGSHHAAAAASVGREDEYSNRMRQKYGGEW
jgi:hypothetical protein